MTRRALICLTLFVAAESCTEPYNPKLSPSEVNVLVVDGLVDTADGTAQVKLSRAVSLASADSPAETGAKVTIEEQGGMSVTLVESDPGSYSAKFVSSTQKQYRVSITTTDGKKYVSDYVTASQAPAIDTVFWKSGEDGISIVVNSHDPTNQTHFYRWTFEETWAYSAAYSPTLILQNGKMIAYLPPVNINNCWHTAPSQSILIYSTSTLSNDRVSEFAVTFIPANSQRLSERYSMEVKQYAISQDEYNFWKQLQATTQNLGGIFDPLPTQVIGNVRNESDEKEMVLGYFTAGSATTSRMFVGHYDLPQSLQRLPDHGQCSLDSIPVRMISQYPDGTIFVGSYGTPFPVGYLKASPDCIDCRLQGGTSTKPSFWR